MYQSIEYLREISHRCRSGQSLGRELSDWLARSLETYLQNRGGSLEDAFGLKFPQGGVPWWLEEAIRERDGALRELAADYFAGLSKHAKAKAIHNLAKRYGSTAWIRDRERESMPENYAGARHGYLWRAFRSGAPMPLGLRQLQNILE